MNALDEKPKPNHITISGMNAIRGVEYKPLMKGSSIKRGRRYQPRTMPSGTATTAAIEKPIEKFFAENAMCSSMSPLPNSPSHRRDRIADGPLKNSGSIRPADHATCQSASMNKTEAVPTMPAWLRS